MTDKKKQPLKNIELTTEIAHALNNNMRAWAELEHIDAILDADRREREFGALVTRLTRQHDTKGRGS